jgi:cytidine deaminase
MTVQSVTKKKTSKQVLIKKTQKAHPLYNKHKCTCILHTVTQMATTIFFYNIKVILQSLILFSEMSALLHILIIITSGSVTLLCWQP